MKIESQFYSIKEAAIIFSIHEDTIRKAIRKGYLKAIRIGDGPKSPYRISKEEISKIHVLSSKKV
jgi:excisionase family DNA binding protein